MAEPFFESFNKKKILPGILVSLLVFGITLHDFFRPPRMENGKATNFQHHNNYIIFKQSFIHLVQNKNLYAEHTEEHFDYYKYSPAFAVFMAPFYFLPDFTGLLFWNLLNALVLLYAFLALLFPASGRIYWIYALLLFELVTSIQNEQSNALIAGLLIFSYVHFEKRNVWLATLLIALSAYIKVFGLAAAVLLLLYPGKIKSVLWLGFWMLILAAVPLLLISPEQLFQQYQNWYALLQYDHGISDGISVMGILTSWFTSGVNKTVILIAGLILLLLPLFRIKRYDVKDFRLYILSSLLIWLVIFNHRAESPTYIIAAAGVAIWYAISKKSRLNTLLFVLVFMLTTLSPTDLFPAFLRREFIIPYKLKALPCILVWLVLTYRLLAVKKEEDSAAT